MIQLEAVRRLHHQLGFSFTQVDSLRFFTPHRRSRESGLLWDTSQRDQLRWPGMQLSELPELQLSNSGAVPSSEDLFLHLKAGLKGFCPNLSCIQTFCGVHRRLSVSPLLVR